MVPAPRVHRASTIPAVLVAIVAACGGNVPGPTLPSTATAANAATPIPSAAPPIASAAAPPPSVAAIASPPSAKPAWRAVAPMPGPRDGFETVLLGDGSVLVVGDHHACHPGPAESGSERAVVYDAGRDRWAAVQSLNKPRIQFAMVPTIGGGAMVIGGLNAEDQPFSSTKVFNQASATWSDGPLLDVARVGPAAAAIGDGRIVTASPTKLEEATTTSTAEIYSPWTRRWDVAGSMAMGIERLIMLTDGRLLATGYGFEISDQIMVATPNGAEGWRDFPRPDFDDVTELVSLADGGVLALGREDSELGSFMSHRVLRYDRSTNRWHEVAPIPTARNEPQVAVLGDGRVVVAGGHVMETDVGDGEVTRSTEIFNPAGNAWSRGPDLIDARYGGVAMPLSDGGILVMGGQAALNTEGDTPFCPAPMTSVERLSSGS